MRLRIPGISHQLSDRRQRVTATLLALAQLGFANWFFGNLYEAIVRIPHRVVSDPVTSPFSLGSPVRYYIPATPIGIVATLAALAAGWNKPNDRRWLAVAAAGALFGGAVTAHLVREVNLKLFVGGQPVTPDEREMLLRTWYRLNLLRLIAVGGAWLAAYQVTSRHALSYPGPTRTEEHHRELS
jgi:hypothetical protein